MSHIVLIRHGKTEINAWNDKHPHAKRIGGQLESPLISEGKAGATNAGRLVAAMRLNIQLAVSADHERTIVTRDVSLAELPEPKPKACALPGLREISYGEFAGKEEAEIRARYPEFFEDPRLKKWRGDFDQKAPGGENYTDIEARLESEVFPVLAEEPGNILVVSSLHTLRVFLYKTLGLTREQAVRLKIPNTLPILIRRGNSCVLVGDVPLEKLLIHNTEAEAV